MNIWRDVKTAPKHQPVLVTVEGMVCFGRFCDFEDEDYSGLAFDGACLSDGESVSYFADYIDGWQPAPATFRPEKSADEMFRAIGYQKVRQTTDEIVYAKDLLVWYEKIAVRKGRYQLVIEASTDGEVNGMLADELLATAQLIREMEEQK